MGNIDIQMQHVQVIYQNIRILGNTVWSKKMKKAPFSRGSTNGISRYLFIVLKTGLFNFKDQELLEGFSEKLAKDHPLHYKHFLNSIFKILD